MKFPSRSRPQTTWLMGWLGQLDLHPGAGHAVGDPAAAVAVATIVHPFQLMDGVAGEGAGGGGACTGGGQRHVARLRLRREDFQFVQAGLAAIGGSNGEADESRFDRA